MKFKTVNIVFPGKKAVDKAVQYPRAKILVILIYMIAIFNL